MNPLSILDKKASDLGIEIGWLSLDKYTPSSVSTKYNKIAMNKNGHNQEEITFQLAHELAHIINHNDCEMMFYHASFFSGFKTGDTKATMIYKNFYLKSLEYKS